MNHAHKVGYKLSRYNNVFDQGGDRYLYNALTGALIKLDEDGEGYLSFFDGCEDGGEYFNVLKDSGCIVDADYDELMQVLVDEKATMLDEQPELMHYTIAPTLSCNYACTYCFEEGCRKPSSMTQEMQDDVCSYIEDAMARNDNLKRLGITWFGGEPLLAADAVERISARLMGYCEEHGIEYGAGIVTNGRLLTAENAQMLERCKVTFVQLAMDGMPERYKALKRAKDGDFEAVVDNIKNAAPILPISVRINAAGDLGEAKALTEYLLDEEALDGKIKIYLAHVRGYDYECEGFTDQVKRTHEEFLRQEGEFIAMFGEGGRYAAESIALIKPCRRCTTCLNICGPNLCIGPEGEFYRCEHHFGDLSKVAGSVKRGRLMIGPGVGYLMFRHPQQCLDCSMFPVCLGGCMNDAKLGKPVIACDAFKVRMLELAASNDARTWG
jgi:uncharacterized protein